MTGQRLFVDLLLDACAAPPEQIILDLDATDDPRHGQQEGRFFHGDYRCSCDLPLDVFGGDHLLAAKLRRSDCDASAGVVEEVVVRLVAQIRARWPLRGRRAGLDPCGTGSTAPRSMVRIVLRADRGFAREALMGPPIAGRSAPPETEPHSGWCAANRVDDVLGLARNASLSTVSTSRRGIGRSPMVREIAAELDLSALLTSLVSPPRSLPLADGRDRGGEPVRPSGLVPAPAIGPRRSDRLLAERYPGHQHGWTA
jgi:hypothetical protein